MAILGDYGGYQSNIISEAMIPVSVTFCYEAIRGVSERCSLCSDFEGRNILDCF
jgi:hypothetical protein